jgi:hypothetical protein
MSAGAFVDLLLAQALERCALGTHMAAAKVDPDGTARIELLERLSVGWRNLTTEALTTSAEMSREFDDCVVTRLPADASRARSGDALRAGSAE